MNTHQRAAQHYNDNGVSFQSLVLKEISFPAEHKENQLDLMEDVPTPASCFTHQEDTSRKSHKQGK